MRLIKIVVFSFTLGFCFSAVAEDPLAVVGEKKITIEEFNQRYKEVLEKTTNPPSKDLFLEDLVRYEIGVQEAQKKKISDDPVVAERIRQEIYKGLIEKELGEKIDKVQINEEQMKKWYTDNPEIRTAHILIEIKPNANATERAAAKKRADEIHSEVKKSTRPFEELVKLYSDDTATKDAGGDIGFQTPLTIVPEYYSFAVKLKKDEVKGLLETKFGFHIVKFVEKNTYEKSNKRQVRAAVFDVERKKLFDEYFKGLKGKYTVKINKGLLK